VNYVLQNATQSERGTAHFHSFLSMKIGPWLSQLSLRDFHKHGGKITTQAIESARSTPLPSKPKYITLDFRIVAD
jgi:hypothetical protein